MTDPQLDELLAVAVDAALASAAAVRRCPAARGAVRTKTSPTDIQTDADRAGESAAAQAIASARPGDALLCEEGLRRSGSTGLRWVVDPLDGTLNHVYGLPLSSVSVACERAGAAGWVAIVGVVHDIARAETFTAVDGRGACLDGSSISVNDPVSMPTALVGTGFGYGADARARQGRTVATLLPRVRDVRSSGSTALDLAWTAAGRLDACYEDELDAWDWSAGALLVRAAGGVVTPFGAGVVVSGKALHAPLLSALRSP